MRGRIDIKTLKTIIREEIDKIVKKDKVTVKLGVKDTADKITDHVVEVLLELNETDKKTKELKAKMDAFKGDLRDLVADTVGSDYKDFTRVVEKTIDVGGETKVIVMTLNKENKPEEVIDYKKVVDLLIEQNADLKGTIDAIIANVKNTEEKVKASAFKIDVKEGAVVDSVISYAKNIFERIAKSLGMRVQKYEQRLSDIESELAKLK